MATKWKKSKLIKIFLVVMTLVMSFTFAFSTLQSVLVVDTTLIGVSVDEIVNLYHNGLPGFFDCPSFQYRALSQALKVERLFENPEDYLKGIENKKENVVKEITSAYASQKAAIIKKELEYIAQNYERQDEGESIYNENGYSEILDSQIPDVPYEKQKFIVDPYASKTVQMVQKILNYAEGTEFLKYASIIRYESFNESEFHHTADIGYGFHCYDFSDTVEEIEIRARREVNDFIQTEYSIFKSDLKYDKTQIEGYTNLKYYVKKGDVVHTNLDSPINNLNSVKNRVFYIVKENGEMLHHSGTDLPENRKVADLYGLKSAFKEFDEVVFYVCDEIIVDGTDEIGNLYSEYIDLPVRFDLTVITAVVSFALLIACVVIIFISAGHKKEIDGCCVAAIDKLPSDIHLIISGGAVSGLFCLVFIIYDYWDSYDRLFTALISACFTLAFALLVEFITSIVRIKKAKGKIFRNCIIIKLLTFIFKGIAKFFKWIFSGVRKIFFAYKMKHLSKKFILFAVLWVLINVVGMFFAFVGAFNDGVITVIASLLLLIFDGATIFFVAKYMNTLDKIIVAATEHTSANLYGERLPQSLTTLNESLKITKAEMDEAVAQAVKNERTKTELITNVSHDLKTPLTSIISYVDLLKKCDIKDEEALKYIDVLSDKSLNLKSLIENLIEASKASTGNIKINKVYLNLKELSAQAIGEFQSDFDARDLELRFKEDCDDVRVFVDGPHTYRVLENLLSNAKKYSANGTRVYASIRREGNFGVFELKNISKDPLNISPDELTERFVRGDASRGSEEGNGLGLSIAKQLCSLQGGELKLSIDGDLFKATVYLPIS
ncbi:MAG: HAMP domain-containing histidine kinase [Clostridia bacterium]|nr:HAMP domain-containing histidine kinase [Clostridia bacterium]